LHLLSGARARARDRSRSGAEDPAWRSGFSLQQDLSPWTSSTGMSTMKALGALRVVAPARAYRAVVNQRPRYLHRRRDDHPRLSAHGMKGEGAQDLLASMKAAATGWRFLARSTWIGPPDPRKWFAPSSQSSDFLNRGNTESNSHPGLPAAAQLS